MEICYRPAEKKDSRKLAELISVASGGVVDYLLHDMAPGLSPIQVLAHGLESGDEPYSYRSAVVAEDAEKDHRVVGMTFSYPSDLRQTTDEMRERFPEERLRHLQHSHAARVDHSWFLDAICVEPSFRGKGIGRTLLGLTKRKARENGFDIVSLIVFSDNAPALALYRQHGFEEVRRVELNGNRFIPHEGGCLLLRRDLSK